MTNTSIFSTYKGGENRVTSSMLAVFQRVGIDITEQILAKAIEESALGLVTFASQPSAGSVGVPDAELKASFHYLIETKVVPNTYQSQNPNAQLTRHLARLTGGHADEKLLVVTPDAEEPPGIATMSDSRVIWTSFALIAQAIEEVVTDPSEPASEQQRFLLRELATFLDAEGLVGVDDTVVVAGRSAYPEYLRTSAYICQPNRSIRRVTYLAFYKEKRIWPEVARVLNHYSEVTMTEEEASRFESSGNPVEVRLAEVIRSRVKGGSQSLLNDIYLLSSPDDERTIVLDEPVRHTGRGAWTQSQRYTNVDQLRKAATTLDLA